MLVLTRKIDEQILIGDDIKITLVRVKGNTVRIGIEAPGDVRILRGELDLKMQDDADAAKAETIDALATVFAHPVSNGPKSAKPKKIADPIGKNRIGDVVASPQVIVGRFDASGKNGSVKTAPLSGFVSAT